ncbi:NAD(P)-dependent oxidoreductase [Bacillus sp. FJAT-49732]|uniref:NAD(P)-dependent oxidoreductase n=1 Tax=Lederbergia citrisecunda TaxID=2833583 RepID=A0A942TRV0_9BACI|nr:NAD(P)-dependent oxidoreductase [Lederbergia citrisecunda]MBS4201762.1 NAD(P)-dependent oxidoreductase [Lederbergia citrisecunda]
MKIGIIGASGKAGNLILNEAVERGHHVTAIVRDATKIQNKQVAVVEKNIFDIKAEDIKEYDVVVNAFNAAPGQEHQHVEAGSILIKALKDAPQTRLIVVGGAGSLFVDEAKTLRVFETPDFPESYLPTASNMGKNLEELQNTSGIQWTYISPAGFFDPEGKRTGSYQIGKDQLILNTKGESYISYPDYAIAVIDEIEKPQHINERFSVVAEKE